MILAVSLRASDKGVVLVREYKADSAALVDISSDGRFILTQGSRYVRCRDSGPKCRVEVLTVYDSRTGRRLGEQLSADQGSFHPFGFVQGSRVSAVSSRRDAQQRTTMSNWLQWDPVLDSRTELPWPNNLAFSPMCQLDGDRFLGMVRDRSSPRRVKMKLADASGLHELQQPFIPDSYPVSDGRGAYPLLLSLMPANCRAWRSTTSYLFQSEGYPPTLHWISTEGTRAPRVCRSFPGERIHGYAVSPDTALLVVVTGTGDLPVGGVRYRVFLNVLDGKNCEVLRRFPVQFPEKPGWTAPLLNPERKQPNYVPFFDQFASHIAISPDNRNLALAYGLYRAPDGIAFFGLYSLTNGRRLATLRGDTYRGGFWHAILHNTEVIWAGAAPITGAMQFSSDSRMLFATSEHLYQWNIADLK